MKKDKFVPILDSLDKLSETEKQDYVARFSEFLGLPPDQGFVGLVWSDTGDGGRALVPYIRRGGTDLIRDNLGISMKGMEYVAGDGFVAFRATATNKAGRQEIAIGACSIRGGRIDSALMTAETRAGRRVTLKFVPARIMDESEVQPEKTTNIAHDLQPASPEPQPVVQPTAAPGKDITPPSPLMPSWAVPESKPLDTGTGSISTPVEVPEKVSNCEGCPFSNTKLCPCREETKAFEKAQIETLTRDPAPAAPTTPAPEPLTVAVGDGPSPVAQVTEAPKKRRGRPRKSVVTIDTPTPVSQTGTTVPQTGTTPVSVPTSSTAQNPPIPEASTQTSTPLAAPAEHTPTKEEQKTIKARLFKYTDEILPLAGMVPSASIGGIPIKTKMFIKLMFPGVGNTNYLSYEQWMFFFDFMDRKLANEGAEALVKFIDAKIGEALAKDN